MNTAQLLPLLEALGGAGGTGAKVAGAMNNVAGAVSLAQQMGGMTGSEPTGPRITIGQPFAAHQIGSGIARNLMGGFPQEHMANMLGGTIDRASLISNDQGQQASMQAAADTASDLAAKMGDVMVSMDPRDWLELGEAVATLPLQIEKWADALMSSIQRLDGFSAATSKAVRIAELGELRRGIQSAQATGESSLSMVQTLEELKAELQPIRDLLTNVWNNIMKELLKMAIEIVKWVQTGVNAFEAWAAELPDWLGGGVVAWFKAIREGWRLDAKISARKAGRDFADVLEVDALLDGKFREASDLNRYRAMAEGAAAEASRKAAEKFKEKMERLRARGGGGGA